MLELKNIDAGYHKKVVLESVSLKVKQGEIVALIGPNGAGKSTVIKTVMGLVKAWQGDVLFKGQSLNGSYPAENVRKGIAYVPQGNSVFGDLTVLENLSMGGYTLPDETILKTRIADVFALFPEIGERKDTDAGKLSGGEKQMLALGRAMMLKPELLLLDEPSLGLSPKAVSKSFSTIRSICTQSGTSILMVEQNVQEALKIADRVYILALGKVVAEDTPDNLTKERIKALFLGT
ncbi:MAG TPA: ABC transporter ATP-binding protein [Dissulfurispiraceae bacterium]